MDDISILKLEDLIAKEQYILALKEALAMVAKFSVIEYPNIKYDSVKFPKWVKEFIIDTYDDLVINHNSLATFKINNNLICKNTIQNIFTTTSFSSSNFEKFIYKLRCSAFHGQTTLLEKFPNENDMTKSRLELNEDNVFSIKYIGNEEVIYICPKYLSMIILFSVKNYQNRLIANPTSDKYIKYKELVENDVNILITPVQPMKITLGQNVNDIDCCVLTSIYGRKKLY